MLARPDGQKGRKCLYLTCLTENTAQVFEAARLTLKSFSQGRSLLTMEIVVPAIARSRDPRNQGGSSE